MGIAILSGVVASLEAATSATPSSHKQPKWESHTPGTMTPDQDASSTPSQFIACVSRAETRTKLQGVFGALGPLGKTVQVVAGDNLNAIRQSDVVILWYVALIR